MINYNAPHRRLNPLTGEWVLVSPHRARRPWLGQVEKTPPENLPAYDPDCYLCPANDRAGGHTNPAYTGTFVFDNDFPALLNTGDTEASLVSDSVISPVLLPPESGLFHAQPESGICKVVCFSPRHDLTLPELPLSEVADVVRTWAEITQELGAMNDIQYVQVFENKGALMGCSNPHPHSQVWASSLVPNEPSKEIQHQRDYHKQTESCLLCDYLAAEAASGVRVLASNAYFLALVPFWAVWPFEVLVLARRHFACLPELNEEEGIGLAEILQQVTCLYDNLFEISFPYSMGFHQAPMDGGDYSSWHLHAHFYPPLLRSATVRKFMVGYEMLAMPQRDLTPETAVERLRSLSPIHYRRR